jgi:hypothetical protein
MASGSDQIDILDLATLGELTLGSDGSSIPLGNGRNVGSCGAPI